MYMKMFSHISKSQRRGFTLIEILIVVVIIGIVGSMGFLSVRSMLSRMRVEQASSRLAFQLQLSRSEAIAVNQMARISLDMSTNQFQSWIDKDRDGTRDADEITTVELAHPNLVNIRSEWTSGMFNAFGQFILTPGQREIKTVTTRFEPDYGSYQVELILRGSGAITKR